jgi:hypothetical protein
MKLAFFIVVIALYSAFVFGQDFPVRFIEVPKPELPKDYGQLDAQGSIFLRAQFLADGRVGQVQTIKVLPVSNLTELAVEAAKAIRFNPATENGAPVNSFKLLQYRYGWDGGWKPPPTDPQAEAVLQKAVQNLGGEKYLKVTTQVGRGRFSRMKDGVVVSFDTFVDVIVFPDKERTEFKGGGTKTVQANVGSTGWVFDGDQELIKVQSEGQIENFKKSIRVSLDNLLRGGWRGDGELTYVGKRAATLGKRNEVIKLTYKDGLVVEFEFAADDGLPVKAIYKGKNADDEEVTEEDRYAQFVDVGGIRSPFIIDRFTNGKPSSRINYETVQYNVRVSDTIFAKPSNPKDLKKDLKL